MTIVLSRAWIYNRIFVCHLYRDLNILLHERKVVNKVRGTPCVSDSVADWSEGISIELLINLQPEHNVFSSREL